ncbi:unnamed protein product [Phaedon cochleariae]|uniref:Uncharacterized protein n=1 Tax=Phaedon cochleariae TaxID=80249 RepID=A0A9N9SHW5_PHACE|nr:unnamed protein product [Phaedon cochleariae]
MCNSKIDTHGTKLSEHDNQLAECHNRMENLLHSTTRIQKSVTGFQQKVEQPMSLMELRTPLTVKKNLIIFGVPEEIDMNAVAVIISDFTQYLDSIVDEGVPQYSILHIHRIGETIDGKVGPLKMYFDCSLIPKFILRHQLKLKGRCGYENLSFKSDKSYSERPYLTELRNELTDRTTRGEKNLNIKYVKGTPTIVSVPTSTENTSSDLRVAPRNS